MTSRCTRERTTFIFFNYNSMTSEVVLSVTFPCQALESLWPMMPDSVAIDDRFPAIVKPGRDIRAARQHLTEAEPDVRLRDHFLKTKAVFHLGPTVREASWVEQYDSVSD